MRVLAIFLVSLERLFHHKLIWFVIPLVGYLSIAGYVQFNQRFGRSPAADFDTYQAIQELKSEVAALRKAQLEEIAKINRDQIQAQVQNNDVPVVLNASTSAESTLKTLYLTDTALTVDVFDQPSLQAEKTATIPGDSIYFFRTKQNDWYEVELNNGRFGWIRSTAVMELP